MELSLWALVLLGQLARLGRDPGPGGALRAHRPLRRDRRERGRPDPAGQPQPRLELAPRRGPDATVHGYGSYYTLDLFNNFTFFLNDPVNGDEINQQDRRFLARDRRPVPVQQQAVRGDASSHRRVPVPHRHPARGARPRRPAPPDGTHPGREHRRAVLRALREVRPRAGPWVRFVTGVRGDIFTYDGGQRVNTTGDDTNGYVTKARPNVKANLILGPVGHRALRATSAPAITATTRGRWSPIRS